MGIPPEETAWIRLQKRCTMDPTRTLNANVRGIVPGTAGSIGALGYGNGEPVGRPKVSSLKQNPLKNIPSTARNIALTTEHVQRIVSELAGVPGPGLSSP